MSLNKFMHPRNIYRTPPNFKELAIKYDEFRKFAKQDLSGKVRVDFKDPAALRALSRTLLLNDFNLDVDIPLDRLVPTLPLRLNYLLWLEDIIKQNSIGSDYITGIDIGTGASCVYPLLGAKRFHWKMWGTEIDPKSFEIAKNNVENNLLTDFVTVIKVDAEDILSTVVGPDSNFTFCMCNPPFFSSEEELIPETVSRSPNRPRPRNASTGSPSELISPGGECAFIRKIIDNSNRLKCQVRFYSVMVGHKKSINVVKEYLEEFQITNIGTSIFCQGHTTRWGIAWSFDPGIKLTDSISTKMTSLKKNNTPFSFTIPAATSFDNFLQNVKDILSSIQIKIVVIETHKESTVMEVTADANTWSNQRRKRRLNQQLLRKDKISLPEITGDPNETMNNHKTQREEKKTFVDCFNVQHDDNSNQVNTVINSLKRSFKNENEPKEQINKLMKIESTNSVTTNPVPLLVGSLLVRFCSGTFLIELFYVSGSGGKDAAHQVLQYLKNKCLSNNEG